jgi:type IV pilus assembly protein PilE
MVTNKQNLKSPKGFTLIELMVVVAIVGILAGIAYPSYQDSITKSRRADAKGALLGLANAMERHFTVTNSYCDAGGAGGTAVTDCGGATNDTGTPSIYTPQNATAANYTFTINAATATTYTLYATRTGPQVNDKCGTLTLTQTGVKGITGVSGITAADCW